MRPLGYIGKINPRKRHIVVGNAANVRCSVVNGDSADMPEGIVVDWWLHFPRSATTTGTPRKPLSVWTILLCIAVCRYMCSGVHML